MEPQSHLEIRALYLFKSVFHSDGLAILQLLSVFYKIKQISKHVEDNENQVFHCGRREFKYGKGKARINLYCSIEIGGISINSKCLIDRQRRNKYRFLTLPIEMA